MSTTTAAPPSWSLTETSFSSTAPRPKSDARDDAADATVVKLGTAGPVEAWSEEKRQALAAGIAEKLGIDPGAITITVTEP